MDWHHEGFHLFMTVTGAETDNRDVTTGLRGWKVTLDKESLFKTRFHSFRFLINQIDTRGPVGNFQISPQLWGEAAHYYGYTSGADEEEHMILRSKVKPSVRIYWHLLGEATGNGGAERWFHLMLFSKSDLMNILLLVEDPACLNM